VSRGRKLPVRLGLQDRRLRRQRRHCHRRAHISQFLVGAAIEQTSDNLIKALNKTIKGENMTTPIPLDVSFQSKRFSYRER